MRIHGDHIMTGDIYAAAELARVTLDRTTMHNSRSRGQAFDITLTGESKRRPNGGTVNRLVHNPDAYAATWDQWGVFLAYLFEHDTTLTIPRVYEDVDQFNHKTDFRFEDGWPNDAHGDHTFRYSGTPRQQECSKCTAVTIW